MKDILDELLEKYKNPEDLIGENGILKRNYFLASNNTGCGAAKLRDRRNQRWSPDAVIVALTYK